MPRTRAAGYRESQRIIAGAITRVDYPAQRQIAKASARSYAEIIKSAAGQVTP